jgi:hypothetical protein
MLASFLPLFDFLRSDELAIYAAMLVAFFGFFWKGNVTIDSSQMAEQVTVFHRADIQVALDDPVAWVIVWQKKTIQYLKRESRIPLLATPGSVLCPVMALRRLFAAVSAPGVTLLVIFRLVDG